MTLGARSAGAAIIFPRPFAGTDEIARLMAGRYAVTLSRGLQDVAIYSKRFRNEI
jgi:hypothetical protein